MPGKWHRISVCKQGVTEERPWMSAISWELRSKVKMVPALFECPLVLDDVWAFFSNSLAFILMEFPGAEGCDSAGETSMWGSEGVKTDVPRWQWKPFRKEGWSDWKESVGEECFASFLKLDGSGGLEGCSSVGEASGCEAAGDSGLCGIGSCWLGPGSDEIVFEFVWEDWVGLFRVVLSGNSESEREESLKGYSSSPKLTHRKFTAS